MAHSHPHKRRNPRLGQFSHGLVANHDMDEERITKTFDPTSTLSSLALMDQCSSPFPAGLLPESDLSVVTVPRLCRLGVVMPPH
jgi:hypothetical protein